MKLSRQDNFPRLVFSIVAYSTVALLISIFSFLFYIGIGAFSKISLSEFIFGIQWNPTSLNHISWGILSLVASTFYVCIVSLAIAIPLGLFTAIYLSEIASPKIREFLKPAIEMIASIPTVILGLLGIIYLAPLVADIFHLSNGLNMFTASILVAITTLPTIASISEDSFSRVPRKLREASLALGASKLETIYKVVIPTASRGMMAALLLGLGRVIGETMIVLMVAGNSLAIPKNIFDSGRSMTANIAIEIKEVVIGSLHWQSLFAIALILFIMTFILNFIVDMVVHNKTII